jgi:hypothetical protein
MAPKASTCKQGSCARFCIVQPYPHMDYLISRGGRPRMLARALRCARPIR